MGGLHGVGLSWLLSPLGCLQGKGSHSQAAPSLKPGSAGQQSWVPGRGLQ